MIQAHSYTPAIVYVEAGAAITKHMVVCMTIGGKVYPATPILGPVLGVALSDANEGEFLTVQTDGVLYNYEGPAAPLSPGCWYQSTYTSPGSMVTDEDASYTIGIAITDKILQLRFTGQGSGTVIPTPPPSGVVDGGAMSDIGSDWDDWDSIDGGSIPDWAEGGGDSLSQSCFMASDDGSVGAFMASDLADPDQPIVGALMPFDDSNYVEPTQPPSGTTMQDDWDNMASIGVNGSLSAWSSIFEE